LERTPLRLQWITEAYNALEERKLLEATGQVVDLAVDGEPDHEAFKYILGANGLALLGLIFGKPSESKEGTDKT